MARPTDLNAEVIARVVEIIGPGVRRKDAALAAGISESAYYNWLKRGNREIARMEALALDEPDPSEAVFVEFVVATTHAWAEAKATALLAIRQGMVGDGKKLLPDWRAAAWWLERSFPIEYGRQRVVVERADLTPDLEPVDVDDMADAIAQAAEQYLAEQEAK